MGAVTLVSGTVKTTDIASQKIPVFMDEHIAFEDESGYRFESLLRRLNGSKEVENTKVEFIEMGLYPNVMKCTGSAAAAATSCSVDHPEYAHTDQLLYNTRTRETVIMNEAVGGTTAAGKVTFLAHAGTGGLTTAWAVDDTIIVLPEAHAEGEAIPDPFTAQPRFSYTYVMQTDLTRKNTDLMAGQKEYGEQQLLIDRAQAWIYFKRAKNLKLYLGDEQRESTSGNGRRHTMKGLTSWIATNQIDFSKVGGTLSLQSIGEIMRDTSVLGASSDTKVGIAGQNAWASASTLPAQAIRTTMGEKSWGWVINQLVTPFGNLALEYDRVLTDANGLADVMFVLDMKHIQMVHFKGLGDRMYLDVQADNDIHNQQDVISGTFGLVMKLEELSAWAYGIV